MKLKRTISILFLLLLLSCGNLNSTKIQIKPINAKGTTYAIAKMNIGTAYNNFKSSLEKNEKITVVAELDHSQNASHAGMDLPATRIIFFGNPGLGTMIMKENQLAGLDLPLRVLFYQEDEQVMVLYNSITYLQDRYGLQEKETLNKIATTLKEMIGQTMNSEVNTVAGAKIDKLEGIETIRSRHNFDTTYSALKKSLENNANINIIAEVDHRENAAKVGTNLRPTRLILFGNPSLGTPLMQETRSVGLDLPQKFLVWEDEDGNVNISYNDPSFLKFRHGVSSKPELEKISSALNKLATSAAGL